MKKAIFVYLMITSIFPCSADVGKDVDKSMTMLDFVESRQAIQYEKVPRKVLAFYYTWYGRPENHGHWIHWDNVKPEEHYIASATHYPAKGAYDSYDPEIIDYHINLAKSNGIDGFICTWWGQNTYDDKAFRKVLDIAGKKGFEITVYWENAPEKGKKKIDRAVNDLLYVLNNYGSHPAFMKVDGKPVIFVFGRVMGQVSVNEWSQIITNAQEKYGKDFILIADGYQNGYASIFDGIHIYNICGWVQGKSPDNLKKLSQEFFDNAVRMARKQEKISCITVIPGYDDTKVRKPGVKADRMDGQTYKILWESAISADSDWVLITSFNEWHEGSEIEPSWEDGDKYIKITGEYTKQFKKTPYSNPQTKKKASGISKEKADELRKLYKDKAIAVLPDFVGDSVFWLLSVGLDVKELSWQEVVNSNIFNAKNFPITVYAGHENYTQTVKKKGDVDKAILKYLEDGGTLMVLSAESFPFFYNEKGKMVFSTLKFGLPIQVGWENPPADVKLSFQIDNKKLKGLPESVEFPKTGDLRWRPCVWKENNNGDIYYPLARLKDNTGRSYGDGIAYIEHKVSSPKNAKIIYSWMRMTDILDMDDLLFAIFSLPY